MTNPHRGQVSVEIDGETLKLEYTIDALCQLEDRFGISAMDILVRVSEQRTLSLTRTLIWGALREHHPTITEKQAGEMMRAEGGGVLAGKTLEAFISAWPEGDGEANPPTAQPESPPPAGIGESSSASGSSADAANPTPSGARRRGRSNPS
jgi:hypothetical protein